MGKVGENRRKMAGSRFAEELDGQKNLQPSEIPSIFTFRRRMPDGGASVARARDLPTANQPPAAKGRKFEN